MIGAATLDIATYEEVEHDQNATGQAAMVVAMVAAAEAIGASPLGWISASMAAVGALVGWVIWSGVIYLVGEKVFGGTVTWGEVLRAVGFAQAPGVLLALGFIPILGWPVTAVVSLWVLVTVFVGTRQALDLDNGKTFMTILVGWLILTVLRVIF
jgi:hypothetical protein